MRITKNISLAMIVSSALLVFSTIPSLASEVPTDKYTYTLSGQVGTQSETIEFENSDGAQAYNVILVQGGTEIKFTPKEKMSAAVRAYDPDGGYSGNLMWTIDGSEEAVTEIEANKTATATLVKNFWGLPNPYYVLSFGTGNDTTKIVYKISEGTATPTPTPKPTPSPSTPTPKPTPSTSTTTPKPAPSTSTTTPKPVPSTSTTTPKPVPSTSNATYKVQQGDTLATIALNNYGSYKYHTKIYNANKALFKKNNNRVVVGMTLVLPKDGLLPALKIGSRDKVYTVKAGDTLGKISAKFYGDSSKYKKIYEANKDRIKNPNMIYEGQKIVITK
ncbi:LysM peptidoglycan-binding domain-containing protein [Ruminiclostridium papyrosolvens]|uniref:Peptidoglycan-binding protein LysM n=1 Tax=Ruminiclostridium papyrosolvens C7 TaxID=1330534 RepID=U4QZQ2_9FIRM|nr:LysM peptidoglycan-binding domain-containing protein [Ruminiclostridium papyrosolvens]EPR10482.1 peptidoglycan-binding protein LysM [Ruminiclostridium papyrosolvens C7]